MMRVRPDGDDHWYKENSKSRTTQGADHGSDSRAVDWVVKAALNLNRAREFEDDSPRVCGSKSRENSVHLFRAFMKY